MLSLSLLHRACLLGALLLPASHAATIVSVTDPAPPSGTVLNLQVAAVSWTSSGPTTDVSISANVRYQTTVNTLNAYLTTSVGPGAAIVASTTLTVANAGFADVQLFSGLSLNAGTYYLVLSGTQVVWALSSAPTVTTFAGVVNNPELFANGANGSPDFVTPPNSVLVPTSTFTSDRHLYSVTGTPTPEPSTLAFAAAGLLLLRLRRR